jgi:hypothetical protein
MKTLQRAWEVMNSCPQNLMDVAVEEMKKQGVSGTVKNLSELKRVSVPKKG